MFCSECGASITTTSKFCSACGENIGSDRETKIEGLPINQLQSTSNANGNWPAWIVCGILVIGGALLKFYPDQLPDCNNSQVKEFVSRLVFGEEMSSKIFLALKFENVTQQSYETNTRSCFAKIIIISPDGKKTSELPVQYKVAMINEETGTFNVNSVYANFDEMK